MAQSAAPPPPPFPLWGGDERFRAGLDALIGLPHQNPERFHPKALPIRRLVAVYGSRGAQKRRVIATYCATELNGECPVLYVSVASPRPEDLELARTEIDKIIGGAPVDSPYGADAVLLINHAQHFQRDPHALTWERKAAHANVVVFALLDSVPEVPQFNVLFSKARLYLGPPASSALRIAQMRWHFAHYAAQCPEMGRTLNVDLSEDEWIQLADCFTKLASPQHLKQWVQRFLYDGHTHITFALATTAPYVTHTGGDGPHIVARSLATEENAFSEAAGLGPLTLVPPIARVQQLQREHRAKKQKIDEVLAETARGDSLPPSSLPL